MTQTNILDFTQKLLHGLNVPNNIIQEPFCWDPHFDGGLREGIHLSPEHMFQINLAHFTSIFEDSIIAQISDAYHCEYICVKLPAKSGLTVFIAGPFTYETMTVSKIIEFCNTISLPANLTGFMLQYYQSLPLISDARWIKGLMRHLAAALWNDTEITLCVYSEDQIINAQYISDQPSPSVETIRQLEKRYESEAELVNAVINGDLTAIEQFVADSRFPNIQQRCSDALRDTKNRLIILNTICRKAAEMGQVHPVF